MTNETEQKQTRRPGRPRKAQDNMEGSQIFDDAAPAENADIIQAQLTAGEKAGIGGDILGGQRMSRNWMNRRANSAHRPKQTSWEPQGMLSRNDVPQYIEPDTGEAWPQKWVRTMLGGRPDVDNVMRHLNEGWLPRPANTAPEGRHIPLIDDKNFGEIIGIHGNILMFLDPLSFSQKQAAIKQQADRQDMAVKTNNFQDGSALNGLAGEFNVPEMEVSRRSRVAVGERPAPVDAD